MTVEEGIMKIQVLFNIEEDLRLLLKDFKEVCLKSPLSNTEVDAYITEYVNSITNLKRIHSNIVGSYLDWILDVRAK